MSYGIEIQAKDDPWVRQAYEAMASVVATTTAGKFLVDQYPFLYPILKFVPPWFPGAEWKRKGLEWRKLQERTRRDAFKESLKCIVSPGCRSRGEVCLRMI